MKKIIAAAVVLSFLSISSLSFAGSQCTLYHKHPKKQGEMKTKTLSRVDVLYEAYQPQQRFVRAEDVELYPEDYKIRPAYLHLNRSGNPTFFHTNRWNTVNYVTPVYFHSNRIGTKSNMLKAQRSELNWIFYHQNRMARAEGFEPTVNQVEPNFGAFTDTYAQPILIEKTYFHKHRHLKKSTCK